MILNLLTSPRFWLLVIIAGLQALVVFKVIDGTQSEALTQIVQTLIGGIVVIRTVDRQSDKMIEATKLRD